MPYLLIVIICSVFLNLILLFKTQSNTNLPNTASLTQATSPNLGDDLKQNQIEEVISQVAKLTDIPQNEKPSVATITDPLQLSGMVFFKNAQKGDKLLIFNKNRRAIIYRPAQNIIIEAGPFEMK